MDLRDTSEEAVFRAELRAWLEDNLSDELQGHRGGAEGTEVTGSPEIVLLRGNVLGENGDLVAEPGVGQFVERAAFGQELLPAAAR